MLLDYFQSQNPVTENARAPRALSSAAPRGHVGPRRRQGVPGAAVPPTLFCSELTRTDSHPTSLLSFPMYSGSFQLDSNFQRRKEAKARVREAGSRLAAPLAGWWRRPMRGAHLSPSLRFQGPQQNTEFLKGPRATVRPSGKMSGISKGNQCFGRSPAFF